MGRENSGTDHILTHLSLFSGIGGLDLAAEWAGFTTVGQCEFADYPTKVLEKHWPDVPRWRDIRTLTGRDFYAKTNRRTVDIISGGFPCQPFSVAGKRRGEADDRFLWPEMVRVIKELRPTWIVGENVAGIINMALDKTLSDLEGEGYATRAFLIPACGVNAPHERYRIAICARNTRTDGSAVVADADSTGLQAQGAEQSAAGTTGQGIDVADTNNRGGTLWGDRELHETYETTRERDYHGKRTKKYEPGEWWTVEPNVGRMAYGVPHRVDRIRCLGNAVVPQQFYPIFKAIAEIETC